MIVLRVSLFFSLLLVLLHGQTKAFEVSTLEKKMLSYVFGHQAVVYAPLVEFSEPNFDGNGITLFFYLNLPIARSLSGKSVCSRTVIQYWAAYNGENFEALHKRDLQYFGRGTDCSAIEKWISVPVLISAMTADIYYEKGAEVLEALKAIDLCQEPSLLIVNSSQQVCSDYNEMITNIDDADLSGIDLADLDDATARVPLFDAYDQRFRHNVFRFDYDVSSRFSIVVDADISESEVGIKILHVSSMQIECYQRVC